MTSTPPGPQPDHLVHLHVPPRDQFRVLDLTPLPVAGGGHPPVVVRLLSGDPLEGERGGPDRFLAWHRAAGEMWEVVAYLSYGQAERDAEAEGWDRLLARVLQTARRAVVATPPGDRPLDVLDDDAAPVEGWTTEGWQRGTIGVLLDLAEAEDGPYGLPDEPLRPEAVRRPDAACPACGGRELRAPYEPPAVLSRLCRIHERQYQTWADAHAPTDIDSARTFATLVLTGHMPVLSGIGAGLRAIDEGEETAAGLVRRARGWFDRPGGLSAMYRDHEALGDAIHQAANEVRLDEGVEAALALLDDVRFLVPEACWLADMDELLWRDRGSAERAAVLAHVEADHQDEPGALHGAGESRAEDGDEVEAAALFRRAYVRAKAVDQPAVADLAESGLRRLGLPVPVEPTGTGRNDPCPCGSGQKAKRCCLR
jgi:hypothetical protein